MKPLVKFAAWLDRKTFFSCRLWEFNLHNLTRLFPWYYLFTALCKHPRKTVRGFVRYQKLVRASNKNPLYGTIAYSALLEYLATTHRNPERFLIAPGFCMKPYDEEKNQCLCPAGHFNHRCIIAEQPGILVKKRVNWPIPCNYCSIGALVRIAAGIQADFYIMTSAIDIARDVFRPALQGHGARTGLFLLCPYSAEAFTFGLATSGIYGSLVTFCAGDCRNHAEFTSADIGIKNKQTHVDKPLWEQLIKDLQALGNGSGVGATNNNSFSQAGHVYRFENQPNE
ncbi:MAG TPA: hypothetical protein PLP19_05805 [bacterium]|nr:hypothetical protein [bacterium]HPN42982.1 hypothetical protein [bacterium]